MELQILSARALSHWRLDTFNPSPIQVRPGWLSGGRCFHDGLISRKGRRRGRHCRVVAGPLVMLVCDSQRTAGVGSNLHYEVDWGRNLPSFFHVTITMETLRAKEALILSFKGVADKSSQPCPPAKSQAGKVMRDSCVCVCVRVSIQLLNNTLEIQTDKLFVLINWNQLPR